MCSGTMMKSATETLARARRLGRNVASQSWRGRSPARGLPRLPRLRTRFNCGGRAGPATRAGLLRQVYGLAGRTASAIQPGRHPRSSRSVARLLYAQSTLTRGRSGKSPTRRRHEVEIRGTSGTRGSPAEAISPCWASASPDAASTAARSPRCSGHPGGEDPQADQEQARSPGSAAPAPPTTRSRWHLVVVAPVLVSWRVDRCPIPRRSRRSSISMARRSSARSRPKSCEDGRSTGGPSWTTRPSARDRLSPRPGRRPGPGVPLGALQPGRSRTPLPWCAGSPPRWTRTTDRTGPICASAAGAVGRELLGEGQGSVTVAQLRRVRRTEVMRCRRSGDAGPASPLDRIAARLVGQLLEDLPGLARNSRWTPSRARTCSSRPPLGHLGVHVVKPPSRRPAGSTRLAGQVRRRRGRPLAGLRLLEARSGRYERRAATEVSSRATTLVTAGLCRRTQRAQPGRQLARGTRVPLVGHPPLDVVGQRWRRLLHRSPGARASGLEADRLRRQVDSVARWPRRPDIAALEPGGSPTGRRRPRAAQARPGFREAIEDAAIQGVDIRGGPERLQVAARLLRAHVGRRPQRARRRSVSAAAARRGRPEGPLLRARLAPSRGLGQAPVDDQGLAVLADDDAAPA